MPFEPQRDTRPPARPVDYDEGLSLQDYLLLFRRWWWLASSVFVAVVLVALAWTFTQSKQYQSNASIVIRTESSAQLFPLSGTESLIRIMTAESEFLKSTEFELSAQERAGNEDPVDVEVGDVEARVSPSLITFTATSANPEQAANTAQAWAETYVEIRHQTDLSETAQTVATLENSVAALAAEREEILAPLEPIDKRLNETEDTAVITQLTNQRVSLLQSLEPELQPIDSQLAVFNDELAQQRLVSEFLEDPNASARVNSVADVPTAASSPSIPQNLALGAVGGALLAAAAVLTAASMDNRIRSVEEMEDALGAGPLTTVPNFSGVNRQILINVEPTADESFQRLISTLDFTAAAGHRNQVLVVTSAEKGEAKSTVTANLATALANEGRRVIAIGGDLRQPTLSSIFQVPHGPGVANHLTSGLPLENCLHTASTSLAILPAGTIGNGRNPAEVLRSQDLMVTVDKLRDHCDHILIDAPPVLPVVDSLELAAVADGVIFCAFVGRSQRRSIEEARRRLTSAGGASVLGFVLSGVANATKYYGNR